MSEMQVCTGTIKEFGAFLGAFSGGCIALGRALAEKLDIPFHDDRREHVVGYRYWQPAERHITVTEAMKSEIMPKMLYLVDGETVECDEPPEHGVPLTEQVWSHDHDPDSYNDIPEAIQKIRGRVVGIYYSYKQMNLVLMDDESGQKIGIRSTAIGNFGRPNPDLLLFDELVKKQRSNK